MKKFLLLLFLPLLFSSCSKESDAEDITFELLKIDEVTLPDAFYANSDNNITIKFMRPTDCHAFNRFYYEKNGQTRIIAVEASVFHHNNGNCKVPQNSNLITKVLKFNPEQTGEYTLKFWKGKDTNGDDVFLNYTILVE